MTTRVGNFLYIGNFADADSDDTNVPLEDPDILTGLTATPEVVEVTEVDGADDGIIHIDNYTTRDDFSYVLGSNLVTTDLDSVFSVPVDILLGDGSVQSQTARVFQFSNGDVFLGSAYGDAVLSDLQIQSITFTGPATGSFAGYGAGSRFVENTNVVCFDAGVDILTPSGPMAAGRLRVGDLVETRAGPHPIRWIGSRTLAMPGSNAPIRIAPGALGPGVPSTPLKLSPQHRVLIRSDHCAEMFGHPEGLIAAKFLLPLRGVRQLPPNRPVTYVHLAFDAHHIVQANSALCETFWPGPEALASLSPKAGLELCTAVPRLIAASQLGTSAAPLLTGSKRRALIACHRNSRRDIYQADLDVNDTAGQIVV